MRHHFSPELDWAGNFDPPSLLRRTAETDFYKLAKIFLPLLERHLKERTDLDWRAAVNASFLAPRHGFVRTGLADFYTARELL
ncbi:MAG: hypothetical protein P4L26_11495 [Terracidiphilus sp.]|nr:hypothetical protein [Terracidiphilus sp.]